MRAVERVVGNAEGAWRRCGEAHVAKLAVERRAVHSLTKLTADRSLRDCRHPRATGRREFLFDALGRDCSVRLPVRFLALCQLLLKHCEGMVQRGSLNAPRGFRRQVAGKYRQGVLSDVEKFFDVGHLRHFRVTDVVGDSADQLLQSDFDAISNETSVQSVWLKRKQKKYIRVMP